MNSKQIHEMYVGLCEFWFRMYSFYKQCLESPFVKEDLGEGEANEFFVLTSKMAAQSIGEIYLGLRRSKTANEVRRELRNFLENNLDHVEKAIQESPHREKFRKEGLWIV